MKAEPNPRGVEGQEVRSGDELDQRKDRVHPSDSPPEADRRGRGEGAGIHRRGPNVRRDYYGCGD